MALMASWPAVEASACSQALRNVLGCNSLMPTAPCRAVSTDLKLYTCEDCAVEFRGAAQDCFSAKALVVHGIFQDLLYDADAY